MKQKYILSFMDMASRFALTSEAGRLKVGALLVKNGNVISIGVNGTPSGWPSEVCEEPDGKTLPEVRHAEEAALEKLWGSHETSTGATMFITHSPCKRCAIKVATAKVAKVYFREHYRNSEGVDYLSALGIQCQQIN